MTGEEKLYSEIVKLKERLDKLEKRVDEEEIHKCRYEGTEPNCDCYSCIGDSPKEIINYHGE